MGLKVTNNATSILAGSITDVATSLSVQAGDGAKFPTLAGGDWFPLTIVNSSGGYEIVRCTARTGDLMTITRAQEGTAAAAFAAGDRVDLRFTAAAIAEFVTGATALLVANNLSDLNNAATARTNLGLGGAAVLNVGTAAGTVAAGDDSRITGAAQKASNLSDLASAATARTNLGLGTAAVQAVGTAAGNVPQLDATTAKMPAVDGSTMTNLSAAAGFGTAATKNVGTAAGNVVQLDATTAKLPAVDGSLLTGINAAPIPTSSTLPVGACAFLAYATGTALTNGSTVAGSALSTVVFVYDNSTGASTTATLGAAQSGTWKNISGASLTGYNAGSMPCIGLFVRTA